MRNVEHYRQMFQRHDCAGGGVGLAARAVWAAAHPGEDATNAPPEQLAEIHRDLRAHYGEVLGADNVLHEMGRTHKRQQKEV